MFGDFLPMRSLCDACHKEFLVETFTTPPLLSGLIHLPVTWVFAASLMFIFLLSCNVLAFKCLLEW